MLRPLLSGLLVLSLGCATFSGQRKLSNVEDKTIADESFTIVVLPDTQYYSSRLPEAFMSQTRWITRNAAERKIALVLGVGDIVDNGSSAPQWENAERAVEVLKNGTVPYFLAIGNHDYDGVRRDRQTHRQSANQFNHHFGPDHYLRGRGMGYGGSMEAGKNENFFATTRMGTRDYLLIALEFSPRNTTLEWASNIIQSHPEHEVIVFTHSYMYNDDTRVSKCDQYAKATYRLNEDNDGEEVWHKFVKKHAKIRLVLSGHIPVNGVGRRFDLGEGGNLVHQILSDYQGESHAGGGFLRLMTFVPSRNLIQVTTYSPYMDEHPEHQISPWKRDPDNEFDLEIEAPATGGFNQGKIHGIVKSGESGEHCHGLAGATVHFPGGSVTTDQSGRFNARVSENIDPTTSPYRSIELTIEKKGWRPKSHRATLRDQSISAAEIYLDR